MRLTIIPELRPEEWAACGAIGAAATWFGVVSILFVISDVRTRRIPNRVVLPALAGVPLLCVFGIMLAPPAGGAAPRVLAVIGGGAACFVATLLVALAGNGALGGGDVKLAALGGAVLGAAGGWSAVWWGMTLAALLAGLWALLLLLRGHRGARLPAAPFLVAACWVVGIGSLILRG